MNTSTRYERDVVADFHNNPINQRVCLPDGSLAIVKAFQDTDEGRIFKVKGVHCDGRFRKLDSISCWFSANELRIFYYSASVHPDWVQS